jgi:hypothetical protein
MATNIESIGSTDPDFTDSMGVIGVGAVNVKMHFGAVGDGVADDTTAIQNALDESVIASNGWTSGARGGVYFPPGTYKITSTITLNTGGQGGGRIFAHRGTVLLTGSVNGFLFENTNIGEDEFHQDMVIEGLNFYNSHASGGCVKLYGNSASHVRDCNFKGHHGLFVGGGAAAAAVAFDSTVAVCTFNGIGTEGSWSSGGIGLAVGHQVRAIGCAFTLWDVACVTAGAQASLYSCRFEVNNVAIYNGIRTDLSTASSNPGGVIVNSSFESNKYDIYIRDANGLAIIGAQTQGNQDGLHDSQASLRYVGGKGIVVQNYVTSGTFDVAPFWIESDPSSDLGSPGITFISCVGSMSWEANTHAGCCQEINCDFNASWFVNTVAKLPTYATAGMRRTVSNANQVIGTDAWGSTLTAHVSTGSWAPCWYDGSVWRLG